MQSFMRKSVFISVGLIAVLLMSLGHIGNRSSGFAKQRKREGLTIQNTQGNFDVFLLGDSHADHLFLGLSNISSGKVVNQSSVGCIPFLNVDRYDYRFVPGECAEKMNEALNHFADNTEIKNIILASMGPTYLDASAFRGKDTARITGLGVKLIDQPEVSDRWRVYEIGMRNTLDMLSKLEDKNIIFMIDIPELGIDGGCASNKKIIKFWGFELGDLVDESDPNECKITRTEYDNRVYRYRELILNVLAEYPEIKLFDPENLFCDSNWCYGHLEDIGFLYRNVDHLSETGSNYIAQHLIKLLE